MNEGDEPATFFEVVFTFKNDSGTAVGTETTYVYAIDPGGAAHAAVDGVSLQAEASSVEASAIVHEDDFMAWEGLVIPVVVTSVARDQYSGLLVTGTATNPGDTVLELASVTCVLRSGGVIVGGVQTSLDTMPPRGQSAWEAFSLAEGVVADAAECSGGVYE